MLGPVAVSTGSCVTVVATLIQYDSSGKIVPGPMNGGIDADSVSHLSTMSTEVGS